MIFAAGFGTRMGSLTKGRPKPLIHVAGKALLDHALALTASTVVSQTVVNAHYHANQIAAHLADKSLPCRLRTKGFWKLAVDCAPHCTC